MLYVISFNLFKLSFVSHALRHRRNRCGKGFVGSSDDYDLSDRVSLILIQIIPKKCSLSNWMPFDLLIITAVIIMMLIIVISNL